MVRDVILWNGSSSVPRGLYVRMSGPPALGAFVTVRARDVSPGYAAIRGFTDAGDRFIKRVAAVPGDTVCADGSSVTIDRAGLIERADRDSAGRQLPRWMGCRRLKTEVFLLGDNSDSFDGRYWGPTPLAKIEGVWRPL